MNFGIIRKIGKRGNFTIPKPMRDEMGFQHLDLISFRQEGSVIVFQLSQKETLELNVGKAEVQVRFIDSQGVALATTIGEINVERVLLPGEIEYRGD